MSKKQLTKGPEINVGEAISQTERFLEENRKALLISLIAVLAVVAVCFGYHYLYRKPLKEEAMAQMFVAEQYFRAEQYELALYGDGNSLGFLQVIDDYGKAAPKSVYMYAGVSHLQSGNYNEAIPLLKRYSSKDPVLQARAICNIGDAYASLSNNEEALNYYMKAANHTDNLFTAAYLMKAAIVHEQLGNKDKAIQLYESIKLKYPMSMEGYEADKYISRLQQQQ